MAYQFDADDIFDELSVIYDPERAPSTLADLEVVSRPAISVTYRRSDRGHVRVELKPTVPHCHLMALIALCVRVKLHLSLPVAVHWSIEIRVAKGSHLEADAVERQANDKERVAGAMENPVLIKEVRKLIREDID